MENDILLHELRGCFDFFMEEYSDWWKSYCSRREFIKRRKEAVTNFLTLFDNYEEPKI